MHHAHPHVAFVSLFFSFFFFFFFLSDVLYTCLFIGGIDINRMRIIREMSQGILLTFHRAFDVSTSSVRNDLQVIVHELRCDRLLTSGRAPTAYPKGEKVLRKIVQTVQSMNRPASSLPSSSPPSSKSSSSVGEPPLLKIIAAAGVNAKNAQALVRDTQVYGVHAGWTQKYK